SEQRLSQHEHQSGIVRVHRGEREEIARRSGGDDIRDVTRRQGNWSAGADEPFHLGLIKAGCQGRELSMERREVSAAAQALLAALAATVSATAVSASVAPSMAVSVADAAARVAAARPTAAVAQMRVLAAQRAAGLPANRLSRWNRAGLCRRSIDRRCVAGRTGAA